MNMRSTILPAILLAATALPAPARAADPFLRRTATVEVVERVGPAVVNITAEQATSRRRRSGNPFFNRFFNDIFEPRLRRRATGLGSGVVIDPAGHVLTNQHVIARADAIRVTLADGREFDAELVGADANNDLAVLRLKPVEGDAPIPWTPPGASEDLMPGEPVIAIGNPFGFSNSVTTGVVSAIGRSIRVEDRVLHGILQTDASINPGNSGGPLLNAEGELIGINTAIFQDAQGIGFAIPIDVAKRVVHELITKGEVAPVWLGLDLQDLTPALRDAFSMPPKLGGALVTRVHASGPAVGGGLARGDVITAVDTVGIRSQREFYEYLERTTPNQELTLRIQRDGQDLETRVRTAELPPGVIESWGEDRLGFSLRPAVGDGYQVSRVDPLSDAARIGLRPGDLVLGLQGLALSRPGALQRALVDLRGRSRARMVVVRGRQRYVVMVRLS